MNGLLETVVVIIDGKRCWTSLHSTPAEAVRWLREGLPRHAEQAGLSVDAMHAWAATAAGERLVEVFGHKGPNPGGCPGVVWDYTSGSMATLCWTTVRTWLNLLHPWDTESA